MLKVKKVSKHTTMHYKDIGHQRSKVGEGCSGAHISLVPRPFRRRNGWGTRLSTHWRTTKKNHGENHGKVSCSGACIGKTPPNPMRGDIGAGPQQRTGAVSEGGLADPDDTLRVALQPRWRTGSPWFLDHCDEEARVILTHL